MNLLKEAGQWWQSRETIETLADDCRQLIIRHTSESRPFNTLEIDLEMAPSLSQITVSRGEPNGLGVDRLDKVSMAVQRKGVGSERVIFFPGGSRPFTRTNTADGPVDKAAKRKDLKLIKLALSPIEN